MSNEKDELGHIERAFTRSSSQERELSQEDWSTKEEKEIM